MRFDDFQLPHAGPPVAVLLHSVYFRLGMDWRWDRFDWCLGSFVAFHIGRALWADGRAIHHAIMVAPRERRWQCQRADRRARRAAAYLRNRER